MSNPLYTYDGKQHVTARELRGLGLELDEKIPDDAFVPREALKFDIGQVVTDGELCGSSFQLYARQPFRWVSSNLHKRDGSVKKVAQSW